MLTQGEDVEVHALAGRGWSISAIARHLGRDRKTVRAYVSVHWAHTPGGAAALRPPHSRRSRLPCFGADSAAVVVLSAVGEEGSRRRPRRGCVAHGLGERGARGGARS